MKGSRDIDTKADAGSRRCIPLPKLLLEKYLVPVLGLDRNQLSSGISTASPGYLPYSNEWETYVNIQAPAHFPWGLVLMESGRDEKEVAAAALNLNLQEKRVLQQLEMDRANFETALGKKKTTKKQTLALFFRSTVHRLYIGSMLS